MLHSRSPENFDIPVFIGQDLKLDVPRRGNVLLQINVRARKRRPRFLLRLRQQTGQFRRLR